MNKLKELLFLKSIKGLGNAKIHDNYLDLLDEASDLDDLIAIIEYKFNKSLDNLERAKLKAEELFEFINNDAEIDVITFYDDNYPIKLKCMGNKSPLILYFKGNVDALSKPNIAIIGTRKPSKLSEEFEENLVKELSYKTDKVVVSGLALGCDKIAHQTTVDEGKITVAVLPSGVNVITPASNKKLSEEILANNGCIISEYEPNAKAYKGTYVDRDKIVAAFCDATLVIECGIDSGTMHTVNAANDYNRQIFAYLPTERPDGSYDGNEFILKENENAIKVEDIDEFLQDLNNLSEKITPKSVQGTLFDNYG